MLFDSAASISLSEIRSDQDILWFESGVNWAGQSFI
jgi:hypothetical protein